MSLWVVLMVPVSAFAAVVALAGPQRLAAESSMQEAADDLATFTVAWRDGHHIHDDPLPAFFERCDEISEIHQLDLNSLETHRDNLLAGPPPLPATDPAVLAAEQAIEDRAEEIAKWSVTCERMFEALVSDLGQLGVDMSSLRGFYSDSLGGFCDDRQSTTEQSCTTAGGEWSSPGFCSDQRHTIKAACTTAGGTWSEVPCRISERTVVRDAVHVALAGDWLYAGWAAAQVWPDGRPTAAESVGRLTRRDTSVATPPLGECQELLVALDNQGRPVWADFDPSNPPDSRRLTESVPRRPLTG
ncbi:MAG: hypothetical protein F4011_03880 [Acidimicrobiaceae bacterium]|nr:hypothetical protein [Acidimicrobiaceae bacterium]MYL03307.1 hypothetical protein [Acidimicrobiaceae bacterium]